MNPVLAVTLRSMHADMARLDQVAMNLANAQTSGYKRGVTAVTPFSQWLSAGAVAPVAAPIVQHADLRAGTLQSTGQPLDLALSGPGWFEVRTAQGTAYTRQGNFRADAQGRLVTAAGDPVMGTGGEILLPTGAAVIERDGSIYEGAAGPGGNRARGAERALAQLKVVQFEAGAVPQRLGDGLVAFADAAPQAADAGTEVRQAWLENSNVSSMHEMVQLLQTVRHFESLQKATTGYDEMLGNAIRKLGDAA